MIRNLQYRPFSANAIKPEGWLKKQLMLQANGLAGNLDKIWPDVKDSMWIGGSRYDWERVPYWLDGFIPLAYLLDNADMKKRAQTYVYGIVDRQQDDGWLCPCRPEHRRHYDTWAALLLCKVLAAYCDVTGDERVEDALYRGLKQFSNHINGATLHDWGAARWFEGLIPIFWLYEKRPESWLILLAKKLNVQGFDWERVFATDMLHDLTDGWDYISHVVNLGMMLKSRALMSRITNENPDTFAQKAYAWLYEHHGMACGHFTGDENLSGTSPIQGSELCSVNEAMFSFETLFQISGNPYWLDLLEKEAFNALPATVSPDMWTHQYVQMTNQVECSRTPHRVFRTNNEEAHIFGLEPHFGCCTANMGQGFPKFALSALYKTPNGIACGIPLPMTLETDINSVAVTCQTITDYPFRGEVRFVFSAASPVSFDFTLRIPSHASSALLNGKEAPTGEMVTLPISVKEPVEVILSLRFSTRFEKRPSGMLTLWRGPLLYSLPIAERWKMREYEQGGVARKFPYCDYYIYPESDFNYGFATADIEKIAVCEKDFDAPFTPKQPPIELQISMAKVAWEKPDGRCALLPVSNQAISESEIVTLIPYGCTNLRMTEMPLVEK